MEDKKYYFTILFEKLEEASFNIEENSETEFDKQSNKDIVEQIRYLKEFYDVNEQDGYEVITRS